MAVSLNPRAERLLTRLRTVSVYSLGELLLIIVIAIQCARLFWGMLTPLGPIGDYKALDRSQPVAAGPALGAFDPFFRQAPGAQGPATVTALDIRLHGVSGNQATGGGSAIVSTAAGEQRSVLVGEEIMPGVTLVAIGFDYVTISRGGANEQLYLDQTPVPSAGPAPPQVLPQPQPAPLPVPTVTAPAPPAPAPVQNQVNQ